MTDVESHRDGRNNGPGKVGVAKDEGLSSGDAHGTLTQEDVEDRFADLERITATRRRRRLAISSWLSALVLLVLPGLVGYQFAKGQPTEYEAEAEVLFDIERASSRQMEVIVANGVISAERRELAATVSDETGVPLEELLDNRSIEVVERAGANVFSASSSVLRFKVRSSEKRWAEDQVSALVRTFVADYVAEDPDADARSQIEAILDDLQERRFDAQRDIERAEREMAQAEFDGLSTIRRAQISDELNNAVVAARTRYEAVVQDLSTQVRLLETLQPDGVSVRVSQLGEVYADDEPVSPKPARAGAIGLAAGLVLASTFLFGAFQLRRL